MAEQPQNNNGAEPSTGGRSSSSSSSNKNDTNTRRYHMSFDKVSLKDVQAASPAETNEDDHFMQSIERNDPTGQSMADMNRAVPLPPGLAVVDREDTSTILSYTAYDDNNILGDIKKSRTASTTDTAGSLPLSERSIRTAIATHPTNVSSRQAFKYTTKPENNKSYKISEVDVEAGNILTYNNSNTKHNNSKTLDDVLFDYTKTLNKAHYDDVIAAHEEAIGENRPSTWKMPPPPGQIYRSKTGPMTQADMFAANAGRLLKKRPIELKRCDGGVRNLLIEGSSGGPERGMDESEQPSENSDGRDGQHSHHRRRRGQKHNKASSLLYNGKKEALDEIQVLHSMLQTNRSYLICYIRTVMLYLILPSTIVASVIFYGCGNPISTLDDTAFGEAFLGEEVDSTTKEQKEENPASYSWWILFLGVRQVITYSLASGAQYLIGVHCEGVQHSWFGGGPLLRLFFLQARRVPLQLVLWSLFNFLLLFGNGKFANHWLFYQEYIDLFNANNPAGIITGSDRYRRFIIFSMCAGLAVAAKRFWVGLHFGKKSYIRYAERLATVLRMVVEVTKVSRLTEISGSKNKLSGAASIFVHHSNAIDEWLGEIISSDNEAARGTDKGDVGDKNDSSDVDDEIAQCKGKSVRIQKLLVDPDGGSLSMSDSQRVKIDQLLGEWEEPDLQDARLENPTLGSIVQFRASLGVLDSSYPFSHSFGVAENRLQVIACAQRVYCKLLEIQGNEIESPFMDSPVLKFHTIALTANNSDEGTLDQDKIKSLVKVFRPQRNGDISLLDFCKSIDIVYKDMRVLRANIANEGKMNAGSESFLNVAFYFLLIVIGLAVIGLDPVALFGVVTSFIISISFMVGGAASDYLRGILFILVQQPYDIGDRINVSGVQTTSSTTGSPGWIVKDVTLYHTTVIFGTTSEYATFSNGSLSTSRIINMARSPRATMNFLIQFGVNVPASTIQEFKAEMIEYVKSKPREWLTVLSFRMTRQMAELGYVEYKMVIQHRESWQNIAAISNSLADVQQRALNMSKEKRMEYKSPALPVEMTVMNTVGLAPQTLSTNIAGDTQFAMA